jgi:hypothetical protein
MQFDIAVFTLGVAGGVLAEFLKWYQLRESPNLPEYAKKPLYLILTAGMVLVGGALAVLYGVDASNPLLPINIGISAPLIVKTMASSVPTAGPVPEAGQRGGLDEPAKKPSVLNFMAGR